jgi:hypothetical protein
LANFPSKSATEKAYVEKDMVNLSSIIEERLYKLKSERCFWSGVLEHEAMIKKC